MPAYEQPRDPPPGLAEPDDDRRAARGVARGVVVAEVRVPRDGEHAAEVVGQDGEGEEHLEDAPERLGLGRREEVLAELGERAVLVPEPVCKSRGEPPNSSQTHSWP